jgi:predicted DNA-binding transcriptional regulator YafY
MRHLYQAIEQRQKIEIDYISMSSGLRQNQWIAPANFASDGERLHVRAWSFHHKQWRDYLPVRMSPESRFSIAPIGPELPQDAEWDELVEIRLRPISSLTDEQQAAVRLEFGFTTDVLSFRIRRSLEFYVERRWGLNRPGARLERC